MKRSEPRARRGLFRAMAIASILLTGVVSQPTRADPRKLEPGDEAGSFRLRDVHGNEVDTTAWRGSPGVWLFVSASQRSSEEAMRQLQKVIDDLADGNVRAAVLTADKEQIAYYRQFSKLHDIRAPIVLDDQREVYGHVGVIVLPTTVVLDRRGEVYRIFPGHTLDYERRLWAHLAFLTGRIDAERLERALDASGSPRNRARERAERLCHSADILLRRRLPREAEAELRRAVEADPGFTLSYLRLAELTALRSEFDEAEKLVATARRLEPENHHAKLTLGIVRFRQERLADSEILLKEALVLNPDPVRTNYWLGRVYEKRGAPRQAALHYRAAVERLVPTLSEGSPRAR